MNFAIKLSSTPLLLIFLLFLFILFTLFVYSRTTPSVSNWIRRTLALLRSFALFVGLLLLFEPIISFALQYFQKPVVAVLIDNSASMTLGDTTQTRSAIVEKILSGKSFSTLQEKADVFFYSFSDSLVSLPDDSIAFLKFDGDGSNISAALNKAKKYLSDREYRGAVLLSDGIYNIGTNPLRVAETYGIPIIAARFGSTLEAQDVMINDIMMNEVAYAETKLPVEINILAKGFQGRKTKIHIFENEKEILTQEIKLSSDFTEVATTVNIIPQELGLNRYVVKVDGLENELTLKNNRRAFYIKVLKSKINLWIFAGAPSADFSFLKRSLTSDSSFSVRGFIQRSDRNFYSGQSQKHLLFQKKDIWQKVDGIVFINFPRRNTNRELLQIIETQLVKNSKPLFYIHGPQVDLQSLWQLRKAIPLDQMPNTTPERSIEVQFQSTSLSHPIIRLLKSLSSDQPDSKSLVESIEGYPPLYSNITNVKALAGSEVLTITSDSPNTSLQKNDNVIPIWISYKTAARKTLAIFSYGLWRWDMLTQATGKSNGMYDNIIQGGIKWMVTKDDTKLVRIISNKKIYRGGEQIELTAQVYHDDYRPLEKAYVRVKVKGPQFQKNIILKEVGGGFYRFTLKVLGRGEYTFSGTADLGEQKIGKDTGKFSVEPFSQEFINTDVNESLLRQISEVTGGKYSHPDIIEYDLAQLPLDPVIKLSSYDLALWPRPTLLFVMLLALSIEWLIRKRLGML